MTGTRPADILRHLEPDATADGELLERFLRRDESAFAVLVRRHGPVVLAVCRRITNHAQDAEDAFQAVFLILAKKAAAIRDPHLLGNWLHGVAVRVSQKARRAAARRRTREVQVVNVPEPFVLPGDPPAEIGPVLHEELAKLPGHYRDAIVLCDLRGVSRSEAAKSLGIPEGTLSSRLSGGRKRLADRLARRGAALTAAAIPLTLADRAAAGVPESLIAQTCGLVANWRAGALLPAPILRLTHGSFPMRQTLLLGLFTTILTAAGVAIAARPTDPPKPDEAAKPPERSAPAIEAVAAPVPKPDDKSTGFTSNPKLRRATDLPLKSVRSAIWSPDGKRLAISGLGEKHIVLVLTAFSEMDSPRQTFVLPEAGSLVGFTPDGKQIITDLRESGLVSGLHRLEYWEDAVVPGSATTVFAPVRTVELDSESTHGYAFAADGKTYRTLVWTVDENKRIGKLQVRAVSTQDGAAVKSLMTLDGECADVALSGDGRRLVVAKETDEIVGYDAEGGKKLWAMTLDLEEIVPGTPKRPIHVGVSGDAKVVFVSRAIGRPVLLNGENGEPLPRLEGVDSWYPGAVSFSSDSRLVAVSGTRYVKKLIDGGVRPGGLPIKQTSISPAGSFLTVWDMRTGMVVKSWPANGATIAFHPTKPILAVLEKNGDDKTRLGLWDFSANVPLKK